VTMKRVEKDKSVTPDRRPITGLQAHRLSKLTGVSAKEVSGLTVAELNDKFRWRIDPGLFLFRRICGRVVKKDPVTGAEYPVPFATVHVEDTDCSFLGFFPIGWPWAWLFPFFCHREEIGTATTDACGRFCVWIPRWEVDWILRFRRERVCFPDIFIKPTIRDLLDIVRPEPPIIRPPKPEPDPPLLLLKDGGMTLRNAEQVLGREIIEKLAALEVSNEVGASTVQQRQILDSPAFSEPMVPPLPTQFNELQEEKGPKLLTMLAANLRLKPEELKDLNLRRFIGPFFRCRDVLAPEWLPILDVPDITFRVTQDVDSNGDEEAIYSESYFDVRWNAGPIPDVTLYASQIAVAGVACDAPLVACNGDPRIDFVGLMPLISPGVGDPYHDPVTGYARRPNRPHPSGLVADLPPYPLAKTPYTSTLQLYGCNSRDGAVYYRLRYSFEGATPQPFKSLTWPLYRIVGGVLQLKWPTPDTDGWYPIIPDAEGWIHKNLLLNWPTRNGHFHNGLYMVDMQLGNASKAVVHTTTAIGFRIDNSNPEPVMFTSLAWRQKGAASWIPLELVCPVVVRPAGVDIEFRVGYLTSATHLRSLTLSGGGCGGNNPDPLASPDWSDPPSPLNPYQHWHTDPDLDNSESRTAIFVLHKERPPGAYSFQLQVESRAFNPSGGDGGLENDWNYNPVYNRTWRMLPVAVVNP
jgi:hypothetical protein